MKKSIDLYDIYTMRTLNNANKINIIMLELNQIVFNVMFKSMIKIITNVQNAISTNVKNAILGIIINTNNLLYLIVYNNVSQIIRLILIKPIIQSLTIITLILSIIYIFNDF
jgi:hypothetical protein